VEALGAKLGYTSEAGKYFSVALGQGQEPIAMNALAAAHKGGGWVLLQNIHLTIDWTSGPLEKRVDKLAEGAHPEFRCAVLDCLLGEGVWGLWGLQTGFANKPHFYTPSFLPPPPPPRTQPRLFLSAEPPPALERPLPISLLQNSIKLTNEPPEGLKANLRRAYANFTEEMLESCAKQAEFRWGLPGVGLGGWLGTCEGSLHGPALGLKPNHPTTHPKPPPHRRNRTIIFALCYFHAALLERKKFGVGNLPGATSGIGWNMNYPFNTGDLLCCGQTTVNYLENNVKVGHGCFCACVYVLKWLGVCGDAKKECSGCIDALPECACLQSAPAPLN